ncbi:MAG: hypothetical protein ACRDLS_13305 [Solirubrobacteraceae bacterium]
MTEPVLGYRFWFAREGWLYPMHGRTATARPWLAGVNEARCTLDRHADPPPGETCGCGLHSFYDPEWMLRWLKLSPIWDVRRGHPRGQLVCGITRSWGRVAPGRQSLVAQYAGVLALLDAPELDELDLGELVGLARAYEVPVVPFASAQVWAAEFGTPMPDELRPAPPVPGFSE